MPSRIGSLILGIGIGIGLMAVLTMIVDGYRVSEVTEVGVTTFAENVLGLGGLLLGAILTVCGPFVRHMPSNSSAD